MEGKIARLMGADTTAPEQTKDVDKSTVSGASIQVGTTQEVMVTNIAMRVAQDPSVLRELIADGTLTERRKPQAPSIDVAAEVLRALGNPKRAVTLQPNTPVNVSK